MSVTATVKRGCEGREKMDVTRLTVVAVARSIAPGKTG
jgi:hypothetical protein